MNPRFGFLLLFCLLWLPVAMLAGSPADTVVVGYWSFDEQSGSTILDGSAFRNNGTAQGTVSIEGRKGMARLFNGLSDYIMIPDPPNNSLDFSANDGFRIELSFRTDTSWAILLRKGQAPAPGYMVAIRNGRLQGQIGNREDGTPPDTLLAIWSEQRVDDNQWHDVVFIRDRAEGVLRLFIDGAEAAKPVADPIHFSLADDRPLTLGCWEYLPYADYFKGKLDEVKIVKISTPVDPAAPRGLWHMDETSGDRVSDSSPHGNDGTAYNAYVVPGVEGNARSFDGYGFIQVPNPADSAYNFGPEASFTAGVWFKSLATGYRVLLRRGLAPVPGFELHMLDGRIGGTIGNREDGTSPDTLLTVRSLRTYNDGAWHSASLVRDRQDSLLVLLVDDSLAAPPIADHFPYALSNDRPLTIGRWENGSYPSYFKGTLDEVSLLPGARYPARLLHPAIAAAPAQIDFRKNLVGSRSTVSLVIANRGLHDTLVVSDLAVEGQSFGTAPGPFSIPVGSSKTIEVTFTPSTVGVAKGTLVLGSNDPDTPSLRIPLQGEGIAVTAAPVIAAVRDVPGDNGKQVRIEWCRSLNDADTASDKTIQYSIWRRVDDPVSGFAPGAPKTRRTLFAEAALWDYVETVPAVGFDRYTYVAPTLYDSSALRTPWAVFSIAAHMASGAKVFSEPDSGYSVNNTPPHAPGKLTVSAESGGAVDLAWERPADPDVADYLIYRGTDGSFLPSDASFIGSSRTTQYTDHLSGYAGSQYYRVVARDSAGNTGSWTPALSATATAVDAVPGELPRTFALGQGYPNPFNPSVVLRYSLPRAAQVKIQVHDLLGREVATLTEGEQRAGYHQVMWNAGSAASGVYLVRMTVAGEPFTAVRKVLLVK